MASDSLLFNGSTHLYNTPKSAVITNNLISQHFTLHRATRQGCPLSLSLVALFFLTISSSNTSKQQYHGHTNNKITHKISLYADDILLFLQNPNNSVKELIKIINTYSNISDYTINWNKSTILWISGDSSYATPQIPH